MYQSKAKQVSEKKKTGLFPSKSGIQNTKSQQPACVLISRVTKYCLKGYHQTIHNNCQGQT